MIATDTHNSSQTVASITTSIYCTYPWGTAGWVGLGVTHLSTDWAWYRITWVMCAVLLIKKLSYLITEPDQSCLTSRQEVVWAYSLGCSLMLALG